MIHGARNRSAPAAREGPRPSLPPESTMTTTRFLLTLLHLLGMALATGAAAVKVALLLGARADSGLTAVYLRVVKPVTRLLVTGLVLATATGAAWLVLGRPITAAVAGKLVLAAAL